PFTLLHQRGGPPHTRPSSGTLHLHHHAARRRKIHSSVRHHGWTRPQVAGLPGLGRHRVTATLLLNTAPGGQFPVADDWTLAFTPRTGKRVRIMSQSEQASTDNRGRLEGLLTAWQEAHQAGHDVSPSTLCVDCPELLPELEQQVAALCHGSS